MPSLRHWSFEPWVVFVIVAGGLLAFVIWYFREYRVFRQMLHSRIEGRNPKSIECIYAEDWVQPTIGVDRFKTLWMSAAECFCIDPSLMRPGDKVDELFVSTKMFFWRNHADYLEDFFEECLPDSDSRELLETHYDDVRCLITKCI